MKTPDRSGCSQRTQRGIASSTSAGLEMRNATQRGIDRLAGRRSRRARPRRPAPGAAPRSSGPSSSSMIRPDRSSWVSRLPSGRRGSAGASKSARTWSSKKWANGPCPTSWRSPAIRSVSTTSPSDGIGSCASAQGRPQARVQRSRPEAGLVHDPEAVGEARMLGRREDPAGALELADAAQPLEPRGVEQVLLGGVLGGEPGGRRLVRRQSLGQLHVPVDRVADEVDRGERLPAHDRSGQPDPRSRRPRADIAGLVGRPHAQAVPVARWRGPCIVRAVALVGARPTVRQAPPSTRICDPIGRHTGRVRLQDEVARRSMSSGCRRPVADDASRSRRSGRVWSRASDEHDRRRTSGRCWTGRRVRRRRSCSGCSSSGPSGRGWRARG